MQIVAWTDVCIYVTHVYMYFGKHFADLMEAKCMGGNQRSTHIGGGVELL